MPRRVLTVTDRDVLKHKLETDDGVRLFLRTRQPDDHEEWTGALAPHPKPGHRHLVLDHVDPTKPLAELGPHHPGGRPLVSTHIVRIPCAEPGGCPREAVHGTSCCERHLQPHAGYR